MIRSWVVLVVLFVGLCAAHTPTHSLCVTCTQSNKVWCPAQRECVDEEKSCKTVDIEAIKWFRENAGCSSSPVHQSSYCNDLEVDFDERLGTSITGNMIAVPIQPRILVYDTGDDDQEYDVGGYFSYIPSDSQQKPQFFFFSQSVDRFVATLHYKPYHYADRDKISANASQVLQFLDLTVVGNTNLNYEMVFLVNRKNETSANRTCAFTTNLNFKQLPIYVDFQFTLGAIGLVIWTLGTFVLVNFMIYFNEREAQQEQEMDGLSTPENTDTNSGSPEITNKDNESLLDIKVKNGDFANAPGWRAKFAVYRAKLYLEWIKFVKSWAMTDKEFFTEYGVTLYHYIWFHRMGLIYLTICSIVAVGMGLPTDLMGGANRDLIAGDFATSTIASVAQHSKTNLVHFFIVVINVSLSVVFVWALRKRSFAIVVAEDLDALPAQEFAVEIIGLPKDILDPKILLENFEHVYGSDSIISAHVSKVYGSDKWKEEKLREAKAKHEKEFARTNVRPLLFKHFWHIFNSKKKVDAIDYYDQKINELRPKLNLAGPNSGTGYGYVTFSDRDLVRNCLKNNNHSLRWYYFRKISNFLRGEKTEVIPKVNPHTGAPHAELLNCNSWTVQQAPLPNEIDWRNMEFSAASRQLRSALIILIEVIVLTSVLSVTMGFAILEVARDLYLSDIYYNLGGATPVESIASVVVLILPEAVAIIEEIVAPIVEFLEGKACHVHKSGWRRAVMWHTAFFELMSGLVISRMIYFLIGVAVLYKADTPLNSYHYLFNKTGMDMMKYTMIKTFTVYGIKYPVLCLLKVIQARISGELERPDFDYFDLYAQKIIVIFCVIVWGSAMPLILPLGIIYLGISFVYDRWAIVNFHKKDTMHDAKLLFYATDICSFYFAIAPLATLVIISKLFVNWPSFASALIGFSVIVGVVMLETRRWQYLNQNLKGHRKIFKASSHTIATYMDTPKNEADHVPPDDAGSAGTGPSAARQRWSQATHITRNVFYGVVKGMVEGVKPMKLEVGQRTEEEILKNAYVHPLSKQT